MGEMLIGVYRQPTPARVELDDEARRRLAELLDAGAARVGEIHPGMTHEQIRQTAELIVAEMARNAVG